MSNKDELRSFRKGNQSEDKKQGSILRFIRRDEISSGSGVSGKSNGVIGLTAGYSPKFSTIVVRKPSSAPISTDAASTTAKAFSAFNAKSFYMNNNNNSKSSNDSDSNDYKVCDSGSSSPIIASKPETPTALLGVNNKIVFIDSPSNMNGNSHNTTADSIRSDTSSPLIHVRAVNKRIIDSSSDEDSSQPPTKLAKVESKSNSSTVNILCKDMHNAPPDLLQKYVDTLHSLYPSYEKEELNEVLKSWNCNFSEASVYLENEEKRKKEEQLILSRKERQERLIKQIQEREERLQIMMQRQKEKQLEVEAKKLEREKLLEEKALERRRIIEERQREKEQEKAEQMKQKEEGKKVKGQVNRKKSDFRQMQENKKKMFKMLGASSRFHSQNDDEEDEDIFTGKVNVYVSDDSEDEEENTEVGGDVLSMRNVVLSYLNSATLQEICAIPGCSKKKTDIIIAHRPYKNWDHLVQVMKSEKHVAPEMLNNVKNVLQKRSAVNVLMKKCENISVSIQNTVSSLVNGEDLEGAVGKQPSLLNPEMKLKQYQMIGLNWLSLMHQQGLNGVLADEMGLGKTVQAIAFLAHVAETIQPEELSLIVVPSSTLDNWARELELWCPKLVVLMYHGSQEERRGMRMQILNNELDEDTQVILTTYNMVYSCSEDRALFKRLQFHSVIFDEAHMLKNMNSQRFENLMRINAECRILLTGTPLQNNLVELMSILVFVMPKLFEGKKEELKQVFAMFPKSEERDKGQYEAKRIEQAKRIMKPFFLRRLKEDVLKDLPAKHEEVIGIIMAERQRSVYDGVVAELSKKASQMTDKLENIKIEELNELEELEAEAASITNKKDKKEKPQVKEESSVSMVMTLRKIANHPLLHRTLYDDKKIKEMAKILKKSTHAESILEYIIEDFSVMSDFEIHQTCLAMAPIKSFKLQDEMILDSGKFLMFDQLLPTMKQNGDRVLIFSQFVIVLNIIEKYMNIRGHKFLRLDGQTPVTERLEMIDEFNENKDIFVFLLSTRAGGLGINLTSANTVILHDIDFNPYNDKQAEDRCHRVGQTRPVKIIRFVTKDSIEQGIRSIAQSKLELEKEVTGRADETQKKSDVVTLLKAALGLAKTE